MLIFIEHTACSDESICIATTVSNRLFSVIVFIAFVKFIKLCLWTSDHFTVLTVSNQGFVRLKLTEESY